MNFQLSLRELFQQIFWILKNNKVRFITILMIIRGRQCSKFLRKEKVNLKVIILSKNNRLTHNYYMMKINSDVNLYDYMLEILQI